MPVHAHQRSHHPLISFSVKLQFDFSINGAGISRITEKKVELCVHYSLIKLVFPVNYK